MAPQLFSKKLLTDRKKQMAKVSKEKKKRAKELKKEEKKNKKKIKKEKKPKYEESRKVRAAKSFGDYGKIKDWLMKTRRIIIHFDKISFYSAIFRVKFALKELLDLETGKMSRLGTVQLVL